MEDFNFDPKVFIQFLAGPVSGNIFLFLDSNTYKIDSKKLCTNFLIVHRRGKNSHSVSRFFYNCERKTDPRHFVIKNKIKTVPKLVGSHQPKAGEKKNKKTHVHSDLTRENY
jgi:hypothetical protein